ncbi:MAG: PSD1 and planctomycete cytochrome C domain-containing protein [Bryobacteraceae bacterium]|nr:PSD1 and planctomycete cytochrome C domain-containing protein [Bryobacteraceae bacterium]
MAFAAMADENSTRAGAVLKKNCLTCHGAALKMSGLDLRTRESMLKGGEHGPAIVPGDAENSRLYRFAAALEQPAMPPGTKGLSPADLEVLKGWIGKGAHLDEIAPVAEDKAAALAKLEERPTTAEERAFWSFQPVKRPAAKSIDELWRKALAAKGLKPNPPASRQALIRRAYLDLIGLPPTPEEAASKEPFEKIVEKLLASPHYGERWGRHWLDLARYSDSAGYEFDRDRPTMFHYRDWVVRAMNSDMPYDEFLRLQIAGDEMKPGDREALIASVYLRLGQEANIKTDQTRADELDDLLATTGGAMFGMTLGCARCHNHKFDPIPQKDYYRMQAVFFSAKPAEIPFASPEAVAKHKADLEAWNAKLKSLNAAKSAIDKPVKDKLLAEKKAKLPEYFRAALATPPEKRTEGQKLNVVQVEKFLVVDDKEVEPLLTGAPLAEWKRLKDEIAATSKAKPEIPMLLGVEEKKFEDAHFLHHGSVDSKGSVVRPGVLSVAALNMKEGGEWPFPQGPGTRTAFAKWVTSPENPLTARVMANRIWQHHFGEGLVRTTSNFGKTGERPTHPELLDWLASEFVASGWSIKRMHRLMMLSDVYRQSSDDRADGVKIDPENRLLWRQARQRLEGEIVRDAILAAAGTLDKTIGGPGVHPYIDPSLWAGSSGRTWPGKAVDDPSTFRRSLYIFQKRTIQVPMMELFDAPNGIGSCSRRNRSTIATQALILMNNAFVLDQVKRFAARLEREAGATPEAQVKRAFALALSRPPSPKELAESAAFIRAAGLTDFAQTIFNLNEFTYAP